MGGGGAGAGRAGQQGVWGGGSDYLLERCLHISKSYVSCLGIKYDIVFYLFAKKNLSWSHSSFHLFNQLLRGGAKRQQEQGVAAEVKFRRIFLLFLPCTLLYSSVYRDFYLYTC